jgi:hypothetical protein
MNVLGSAVATGHSKNSPGPKPADSDVTSLGRGLQAGAAMLFRTAQSKRAANSWWKEGIMNEWKEKGGKKRIE